jgi:quercetin dioxygenase-like cupin family protein
MKREDHEMSVDASVQARLRGHTDGNVGTGGPREDVTKRQMLTTASWQVASIPANATAKVKGSRIGLTSNKRANVAINVYPPHRRDEMHCHPGSEHIFLCWQGNLTIRGINPGEEVTMSPGDLVHVKAGHYYQLCNDTEEPAVLYQVATVPAKRAPIGRRSFRRAGDVTAEAINTRGLTPEMAAKTVWD